MLSGHVLRGVAQNHVVGGRPRGKLTAFWNELRRGWESVGWTRHTLYGLAPDLAVPIDWCLWDFDSNHDQQSQSIRVNVIYTELTHLQSSRRPRLPIILHRSIEVVKSRGLSTHPVKEIEHP